MCTFMCALTIRQKNSKNLQISALASNKGFTFCSNARLHGFNLGVFADKTGYPFSCSSVCFSRFAASMNNARESKKRKGGPIDDL